MEPGSRPRSPSRVAALAAPAASVAADPPSIVVTDGVTQPVFGYTDAIRERLWITADIDSDSNGVLDEVALDIMRPVANADARASRRSSRSARSTPGTSTRA